MKIENYNELKNECLRTNRLFVEIMSEFVVDKKVDSGLLDKLETELRDIMLAVEFTFDTEELSYYIHRDCEKKLDLLKSLKD